MHRNGRQDCSGKNREHTYLFRHCGGTVYLCGKSKVNYENDERYTRNIQCIWCGEPVQTCWTFVRDAAVSP